jgi:excisionase family DNA binding protein
MTEIRNKTSLKFYTTNEIAELLKMNIQVIARKLKHGELIGYKIGKDWRVKESDLLGWLERHSNKNVMNPGRQVVERFMKNGRFESLPVQRKRRKYILDHILKQFEPNRIYTEREINERITEFHDDYCRVRREFVDEGMMNRKDGKYRRNVSYRFLK